MNIVAEKQSILKWIQGLNDEKIIEKILDLKVKNEISDFENQLIQEGLKDIENGNTLSDKEVQAFFKERFAKK